MKDLADAQYEERRSADNLNNLAGSFGLKLSLGQRATMEGHAVYGLALILPFIASDKGGTFPRVTTGIIIVNTVLFFYVGYDHLLWKTFGLTPLDFWREQDWSLLLSSQYLHGGILHLLGNSYFLWMFGKNVER